MSPSGTSTARRTPEPRPPRQSLRVVPAARRGGWTVLLSVVVVVTSLMGVVMGHAMLTQGQVRLAAIDAQLSAEQNTHRRDVLQVASLETPSRIVNDATGLGLVPAGQVQQLPFVSLAHPLPAPTVTAPAPAG